MRSVGFRARMGWTHVVVLEVGGGDGGAPRVVDRREVPLAPERGGYPYHALFDLAPEERPSVLADGIRTVTAHVAERVSEVLADEAAATAGVVVGRGVGRIPLDKVLASSRLFHSAEAAVYYEAIAEALVAAGLPHAVVSYGDAERHPLWPDVTALRKQAGPPWQKDHKMAAVAAWLAARSAGVPG